MYENVYVDQRIDGIFKLGLGELFYRYHDENKVLICISHFDIS